MLTDVIRVPDALLFHRHLGKSAKLLWLVLQQMRGEGDGDMRGSGSDVRGGGSEVGSAAAIPGTGLLQARSGLARHTVLRAMAQLRTTGWLNGGAPQARAPRPDVARDAAQTQDAPPGEACVPAGLLLDRRVSTQAKLLYAILQRTPGYQTSTAPATGPGRGRCTYAQLCALGGVSPNTVKRAVRNLQSTGWLQATQRTKFSPIDFVLCNPVASRQQEKLAAVVRRLKAAPFRGEALMRAYLSLLVDSEEHDDDASPAFLVNPFTGEEMQLDRYYSRVAAFEYQGPQHYGPTEQYPDENAALKQQARDYLKQLICARRGIHLAVVHAEDLSLAGMRAKVAGRLPLRDLAGHEAVINYLEKVSRSYRRSVREGRLRTG